MKYIWKILAVLALVGGLASCDKDNPKNGKGKKGGFTPEGVQLWENGPYWATTNLGAEKPEQYGKYFTYGNTVGYEPKEGTKKFDGVLFNEEEYKNTTGSKLEGNIPANETFDAARAIWGGDWRIPTAGEFSTLFNEDGSGKTDGGKWVEDYMGTGINGMVFTGVGEFSDRSIFLPACGRADDDDGILYRDLEQALYRTASRTCFADGAWTIEYCYARIESDFLDVNSASWAGFGGYAIRPVKGDCPEIPVTGISLDESSLELCISESFELHATVIPDNADNTDIKWKSDNADVATVDDEGYISAKAPGKATIWAATVDGGITAKCEVTVKNEHFAVQLWEGGPYWAKEVISVDGGCYFTWGSKMGRAPENGSFARAFNAASYSKDKASEITTDLSASEDPARAIWGGSWRLPTVEEFETLLNIDGSDKTGCNYLTGGDGSVIGIEIISQINGNFLCLMFPGYGDGLELKSEDKQAYYWTSKIGSDPTKAYALKLSTSSSIVEVNRYLGGCILAVKD